MEPGGDRRDPSEVRLGHSTMAGAQARQVVEGRLAGVLPMERLSDAKLLTDELVTNAIRHAQPLRDGTVGLRIDLFADRVRIVVTDASPQFEWATRASAELAGGFGLVLVDRVADRWGLSLDGQKAVWFEMDVPARRGQRIGR